MTNIDKVKDTFAKHEIGTILSTSEIKDMVILKHGGNRGSIIPSDYCYNLTNKGKINDPILAKFNIFEWISRGKYKYLGENYPYTGLIISNPRNKDNKK